MTEREIFGAALQLEDADSRRNYLANICGTDPALRRRVECLLQAYGRAGDFLQHPAVGGMIHDTSLPVTGEALADRLGPYKLLEQIGEGGFGVVFMAEQQQPVRRKVALKVLKPGMDTKQVVTRFEAERQALALMDHSNIARVLDAGTTDSGRPYFVMELVRGMPITQFCDDNRLTPRERLELFVTVCQAVQHAHQKGVIHRDLKPSNVLVTLQDGTPIVKVIDFGIAKALGQERLTDKTLFTGFAQMIGSPLYMSPEQAEMGGQDADTRTDIYSLGVLLYELLTGTTPFEKERLKHVSYDEIRRIIREEEPARPSTRITMLAQEGTTVSANRKSEPRRLSQLFRGELDWIVMKALEKDRNRRYGTVSSLAADVERYLHDEPVQACPPSAVYRVRKFARRNRGALLTAAVLAFAMLLGVAGLAASTALVFRANQELRQNLYHQHIALAEREWSANNLSGMERLLDACPTDLRGWEWHYLKRLRLESIPPLCHAAAVFSAVFSPDGRWIASGSQDGKATIWDAATGKQRVAFQAHKNHVRSVSFSPDGRLLATASWDKTIKVWGFYPQEAGGKQFPLLTLIEPQAGVNSVAFSPDGQCLASAGNDETVRVWDLATGHEIFLSRHTHNVSCVAYSPDGQSLASASNDTVRIWDARTGQEVRTLRGHNAPVQSVTFSQDGKQLASAAGDFSTMDDGEVKVWSLQDGREPLTLSGHVGLVTCAAFSSDGRRLASGGGDGNMKIWDLTTGQETLTLRGHHEAVRSVAFSGDGNRLVSSSHDHRVRIWDATPLQGNAREEVITLRGHDRGVRSVAFSPDGRHLASAGDDASIRIWDFRRGLAGVANPLIQTLDGRKAGNLNVAFSKDGQLLASAGKIWDATTGKALHQRLQGGPVAFDPDGRHLAAVSPDFVIAILDQTTGREIRTLRGHSWAITTMVFHPLPDRARLASTSAEFIWIWDVTAGKEIVRLPHPEIVQGLAFSGDGRLLASGGSDGVVKVWRSDSWELLQERTDPTGAVHTVAFHPKDSRVLAWGGTDATVKVWNRATAEIRTLHGHKSWVESVAFSPDGEWIASASLDRTVKIWKAPPLAESIGGAEK